MAIYRLLWEFRSKIRLEAEERGLPIPYTGKRRGGHYYRRNTYLPIVRAAVAAEDDDREDNRYGARVKGAIRIPPNPWDDRPIRALKDRNWKRFRRTRWKD